MTHRWLTFAGWSVFGWLALTLSASDRGVTLVGMGLVPGDALDLSGLAGQTICQRENDAVCIDQATFGGFGSALAYTGHDNVFIAAPDRGPFDGRTSVPYLDRVHFLHLGLDPKAAFPNIRTTLLDTRFLTTEGNRPLVGDAYDFDADDLPNSRRFDPEGLAIGPTGTFFISDEYGPSILEFDRQGHRQRRIPVPSRFVLAAPPAGNPSGDVNGGGNSLELSPAFNGFGRQANRGMEGLTLTPDGGTLIAIMQNALLQDHGLDPATISRVGLNNRILTYDLATGERHEYVYVMDAVNQGRGVNDILAVNDHQFLVLERDNRSRVPTPPNDSQTPNLKRIYLIDLRAGQPTDVTHVESLPTTAPQLAAAGILPVSKILFLDLLDPSYKVNATQTVKDVIAEKIEGLAWGADLADGRHVLYVVSDNDLYPGRPTQIYAFAVDAVAANLQFQPRNYPGPMVPPGQVKKALK
ncbi:MAG: esterase-like activity of phytase family protein [Vicinamibacterales bacterium]